MQRTLFSCRLSMIRLSMVRLCGTFLFAGISSTTAIGDRAVAWQTDACCISGACCRSAEGICILQRARLFVYATGEFSLLSIFWISASISFSRVVISFSLRPLSLWAHFVSISL